MFLKTESYRKGIVFSIAFNVLAKGIGFLNSLAVAFYFGIKGQTDIYFFALSFIGIIVGFINAMDLYVVIPEAMRLRVQEGEEASKKLLNFFVSVYILLGTFLAALFFLFPVQLFGGSSSLAATEFAQNKHLLQLGSILFLLMILTNFFSSVLTSYKYFTIPMLTSAIVSLLSVVMIIFFHDRFNIMSAMIGMTAAWFFNLVLVFWLVRKRLGWRFQLNFVPPSKTVRKNLFFLQLSNLSPFFRNYLTIRLLTGLGPGSLTAYNYSNQLVVLPDSFIIGQFIAVSGIKFNELNAINDKKGIDRIFRESSNLLIFIITPLCFFISLCSGDIIGLLFQRGQFTSDSSKIVAEFFRYSILVVPCSILINFASRLFTAFQKIKQAFYYNILVNIFIAGCLFVGAYFFGTKGFLISLLAGNFSAVLLLYFLCRRFLEEINYGVPLVYFLKIILINIVIFYVLYFAKDNLIVTDIRVVNIAIYFVAYAIMYYIFTRMLRLLLIKSIKQILKPV